MNEAHIRNVATEAKTSEGEADLAGFGGLRWFETALSGTTNAAPEVKVYR